MANPQTQQETKPRKDPRPRANDGGLGAFKLKNENSERHYVWVSLEGDAVSQYEYDGYTKEKFSTGRVAPLYGKFAEGADIIQRGNVLMSIDRAEKNAIDEAGWALTNQYEKRMLDRRQVVADTMRGIRARPQHVSMESEIGGLEPMR